MAAGGVSLILEDLAKAQNRDARIYAGIIGFGNFADAFHPTRPNPEGKYGVNRIPLVVKILLNCEFNFRIV